ncbi:MAG: hypothetical protein ACK52I_14835 [Pseudomonadota bacterium]
MALQDAELGELVGDVQAGVWVQGAGELALQGGDAGVQLVDGERRAVVEDVHSEER